MPIINCLLEHDTIIVLSCASEETTDELSRHSFGVEIANNRERI